MRSVDAATGIISTIAGTGFAGPLTDNVPATSSPIAFVTGLAAAGSTIYIADKSHDAVRRVGPDGIITTIAGNGTDGFSGDGGPATAAQVSDMNDLALDAAGNLWLTDVGRIRRVDLSTGQIDTVVGTGLGFNGDGHQALSSGLNFVSGIDFDPFGNLPISTFANRVRKVQGGAFVPGKVTGASIINTYAGTGVFGFSGDGGAATAAQINTAIGIVADPAGNIFFADFGNNRVRRIDAVTRVITTVAGNGVFAFEGDGGPALNASLMSPQGLAIDGDGNLYIGEFWNRVRKVDAVTGVITTYAGNGIDDNTGDGGLAANASVGRIRSIDLDCAGNLYISATNLLRRVDARTNVISTVAGGGTQFFGAPATGVPAIGAAISPSGVAVDCTGNVYISDSVFNAVRRITYGMIYTVSGGHGPSFGGDGGPATNGSFNGPFGITLDARGNVWVADSSNFRIRMIDPRTGIIDTPVNRNGVCCLPGGENVPAANAITGAPLSVAFAPNGDLFESDGARLRRVRILDIVAPVFTPHADVVAEATGPTGAIVEYTATANDDVNGVIGAVCTPSSGSRFAFGATNVGCVATDAAGNSASGSFMVTVRDTIPPVVGIFGNDVVQAYSVEGAAAFFSPYAIDAVKGEFEPVCDWVSGAVFPLGLTTIHCTGSDDAGNSGSATHDVLVVPAIQFPLRVQGINYTRIRGYEETYDETFTYFVPAMTATVTGLAPGDGPLVGVSARTDATVESPAGSYAVIPELNDPFGVLSKYDITIVNGTMSVRNPTPFTSDLNPRSVVHGAPDTVVHVQGYDFVPSCDSCTPVVPGTSVSVNGRPLAVTWVDREGHEDQLDVVVPAALLAERGVVILTISTPAPGGGTAEVALLVTDANVAVEQAAVVRITEPSVIGFTLYNPTTFQPSLGIEADAIAPGVVVASTLEGNPGPPFAAGTRFFDVYINPATAFASLTILACDLAGETQVSWFNGAYWVPASHQEYLEATEFYPPCVKLLVDGTTSPSLTDLTGTYFAAGADVTPPILTLPANITAQATVAQGVAVSFTVSASDALDPSPVVSCSRASGSLFPVGATTVSCTATDASGNHAGGSFLVTVLAPPPADGPDGKMAGNGHLNAGGKHHHFAFRVSQRSNKDHGRLAYWVSGPLRNNGRHADDDEDDDYGAIADGDRRTGRKAVSVFEAATLIVTFLDDPAFAPGPAKARKQPTIDTVTVTGTGRWNGKSGYTFEARAADKGEPGRQRDTFAIVIKDAKGIVVASVNGALDGGNVQSTRLKN